MFIKTDLCRKNIIFTVVIVLWGGHIAHAGSVDFLQVVYDSESHHSSSAQLGWGYAAYIRFGGKTIIFDTGLEEDKFKYNLDVLNRKASDLFCMVASHIHPDHWGGTKFLLGKNPGIPLFIPTGELKNHWGERKPILVEDHKKLTEDIWVVRTSIDNFDLFGGRMHELTLVLKTRQGLVLVVGCSHPGLERIVKRVRSILPGEIYLLTGGFHYIDYSAEEIEKKVEHFKKIGVKKVGPSHCSGPIAEEIFYRHYKKDYYFARLKDQITLPPPLHGPQQLK